MTTTWYLDTEHPIAVNSYDHTDPQINAKGDTSFNPLFNARLYQLCKPPIAVLDVGCGGGQFVETVLKDGNQAVGLEGSDIMKNMGAYGWATIPGNLFTCDVTHPFIVHQGDHVPYPFDAVTAWEFVEHIEEQDLPQVLANIRRHLTDDGLFILSTPSDISHPPRRGFDHHRTRRSAEWWQETITQAGFLRLPQVEAFIGAGGDTWVRKGNLRFVFAKV